MCKFCDIRFSIPEVNEGRRRTPLRQSAVEFFYSYVRLAAPLLGTAAISSQFVGRSVLSFVSQLFARGRHSYAARATC